MKEIKIIAPFVLSLLFFSCAQTTFETEDALWDYLKDEDNGYLHRKSINGVDFKLLYKPTDLLITQELGDNYAKKDVERLREKYGDYVYFNLSIARANQELLNSAGDRERFGALVNTLTFGMEEKLFLFTEKRDTIPLVDYVYPRMYGLSRSTSLILVYPKKECQGASKIYLTLKDLGFNTGEIKFSQAVDKIRKQPTLKF